MTSLVSLELGDYINSLGGTNALTGYSAATDASKAAWFSNLDDAQAVTKGAVEARIGQIIDNAPGALDTLNELAQALGNDQNFSTTLTNNLTNIGNDIAANAVDIGNNATAISANAVDIGNNATSIGNNAVDIGNNATAISANAVDIGNNATAISANAVDIGNNATAISANAVDIGNNATAISANAVDIGNNATSIGNNATAISANAVDIGNNAVAISNLSNSTSTNIGDAIDALTTAVFSPSGEDIFGVDVLGNPNVYTLSDWKTKYDPNTVFTALQSVAGEDLVNGNHATTGTNGFIVLQNYSSSSGAIQWQLHLSEDDKSLNWVDMESGRTMFKLKPE